MPEEGQSGRCREARGSARKLRKQKKRGGGHEGRRTKHVEEKLKSHGLRAPTSAQNSVANQTNLHMVQDSVDPPPRPPVLKGVWVAKDKELNKNPRVEGSNQRPKQCGQPNESPDGAGQRRPLPQTPPAKRGSG